MISKFHSKFVDAPELMGSSEVIGDAGAREGLGRDACKPVLLQVEKWRFP